MILVDTEVMQLRATPDQVRAFILPPERILDYFPQPLDEQYLVLWSGFAPHAWRYLDEPALRAFLLERVADGLSLIHI